MKKRFFKNTEWEVLIYSIILFAIGALALFSATQSSEYEEFKKQMQWFAISIPILIVVAVIDYNTITNFSPFFYFIIIGLLFGVLFTEEINGATSWYNIGFFSFQPSEIAKVVIILFLAYLINKIQTNGREEINKPWKLLMVFIAIGIPVALILKQPDNGTAIAFLMALMFIFFSAGIDKKYIIVAVILASIALPIIYKYYLPEYAINRIKVFLDPTIDPRGIGYNIIQSKLAIGAGQVLGMGMFKGNQTQLGFLYPKTTDFIFSVIGEEFGFIATGGIVILYVLLITKAIYIAKTAKDNVGSYISIGIAGVLFFHMTENIGMTIGLLPITGVPLPFVSYGGSSLLTNFIFIGLLLNISSKRQKAIFIE